MVKESNWCNVWFLAMNHWQLIFDNLYTCFHSIECVQTSDMIRVQSLTKYQVMKQILSYPNTQRIHTPKKISKHLFGISGKESILVHQIRTNCLFLFIELIERAVDNKNQAVERMLLYKGVCLQVI